ncbi:MAG: hypothetical protein AB2L24_00725 [Mangrovibacterium sp.]
MKRTNFQGIIPGSKPGRDQNTIFCGKSPKEVLYSSLDNIWFSNNRLFDLGTDFVKQGGSYLFLDEVHKYQSWSINGYTLSCEFHTTIKKQIIYVSK